MLEIKEREYELIKKLCQNKANIYIYGAGYYAQKYILELEKNNIIISGIIIDDCYWNETITEKIKYPIIKISQFLRDNKYINSQIIIAFFKFTYEQYKILKNVTSNIYFYDFSCVSLFKYDYEYIKNNFERIINVYNKLKDERSKYLLAAYINQRISGKINYCKNLVIEHRYYPKEILEFGTNEVFVDCGAYDGDSIYEFLEMLRERQIKKYTHIYALEPDKKNFEKLINLPLKNITFINKGAYSYFGYINFSGEQGKSSFIDVNSKNIEEIKIDKLDNMIDKKVTFIKMDIQGAEEEALKGAVNLLKNFKPKLSICIAHRPQDIFSIIEFLESLNLKYEYYLTMGKTEYSDLCLIAK